MSEVERVTAREKFRHDMQNKERGGGGEDFYGELSSTPPLLHGLSGTLVVLSEGIVLAEDAPKVGGWVNRLHIELKSMDA